MSNRTFAILFAVALAAVAVMGQIERHYKRVPSPASRVPSQTTGETR